MNIDSIRNEYRLSGLRRNMMDKDPFRQFGVWLEEAVQSGHPEPTAMSVVTVGNDGYPQSRIVLLKYFNSEGFVFFTNYLSNKGISLSLHPKTALHFFWPGLERQVRITGVAEKTETEISDRYFSSRPLNSRIGAVISPQSREIPSREYLESKFREYSERNKDQNPTRPEDWGGYCVKPVYFEFWQGRESRLHDRMVYIPDGEGWLIKRLAP